jgi:hypothetical protein
LIRSFDFHPITSVARFARLWKTRPKDRELRLVVVRRTPVEGVKQFTADQVTIVIPAGATLGLETYASLPMETSLRD